MKSSGYDRVAADYYTEPAWVVEGLLDRERFVGTTIDPSCGSGTIPKVFHARGLHCDASDLVDRGFGTGGVDFLTSTSVTDNLCSNPPYGVIEPYIRHALKLTCGKVAILARLALLESTRRQALFRETPLARVWVSHRRVSMPPGGTDVKASGGTIAYAFFVWDHAHSGPPVLGWLP